MGNLALITDIRDTLTAAKLTALGAGNSRVLGVSNSATVSENPLTIPGNKPIDSRRGGIVVKGGSGSIVLQGQGVEHPTSNKVHFSGFPNGGITFVPAAGYRHPSKISTELWNTGNDSATDRINRADTAFADTLAVEIIIPSGRIINSRSALRGGAEGDVDTADAFRTYRFLAGEHLNEWAGTGLTLPTDVNAAFTHKSNTKFIFDEGCVIWISNEGGYNAATFYPDYSVYFDVLRNIHFEGGTFKGVFGQVNSGGSQIFLTGNVHGLTMKKTTFEDSPDYCFAIGGEGRDGNYAKDVLIEDVTSRNCVTQTFFLLNAVDATFNRLKVYIDDLPDEPITMSPYDFPEPNTPDEIIKRIKAIDCEYHTTLGAAEDFVNTIVFPAQAAATRGIDDFEVRGFICTAPAMDTSAAQCLIAAEGVNNFQSIRNKVDGGLANAFQTFERCANGRVIGGHVKNGRSSRLRFDGCQGFIVEGITSENPFKEIIEKDFYHPVLVNGTAAEMFWHWSSNFGRIYDHYVGLNFDLLNADNLITAVTTPANSDPHGYKTATLTTNVGTKAAKTFTTVTSNTITLTAHGLVTGEPVTMTSAGTLPTGIPKRAYVIVIDANNIKLASTVANALAVTPVPITITGNGSGTHSLTPFYLTAKSVLPADVNTTTNAVTFPNHNLVTGAYVQYENFDGTEIGGLTERYGTVNAELWMGCYAIIVVDANTIKFATSRANALAGTAIDLTSQGTGKHYFMSVARLKSTNNIYNIEDGWTVTLAEDSESKIYRRFNLATDAVGVLPEVSNTTVGLLDPVPRILAKLIKDINDLKPPAIWLANRFYHFKASSLLGDIANGAAVTVLPSENFVGVGSFEFSQATAGLKGVFYENDGDGLPFVRINANQGYAGNEDFPSLAAGFAWALICRSSPDASLGGYFATLNDNIGGAGSWYDANWVFNINYGGIVRWRNSGTVGSAAVNLLTKEIFLGRTGATSKLERNGIDITSNSALVAKPARLQLGNPLTQLSLSAAIDLYECVFWADDLTDEIGDAFNADNMALQGIG